MKIPRSWSRSPLVALVLLAVVLQSGCGGDSTTPPANPVGPKVVLVSPGDLESGINAEQNIVVTFDKDLDSTQDLMLYVTTVPEVVISSITRPAANQIVIHHDAFGAGEKVTVVLGQQIRASNGGELGEDYSWSYWTDTIQVLFLDSIPAHESTGVDINTKVNLLFSTEMDLFSLATDMTVERLLPQPPGATAALGFTVAQGDGNWVQLSFDEALLTETTIRLIMPTTLEAVDGRTLAVEGFVTFETGTEADTTPPQIVSLQPANGSTISASTQYLRFTFSEPINPDSFSPSVMGAQLVILLENAPADAQWTENFTILTVPLPTPMPAGTPLKASFDSFEDLAGNVNTDGLDYALTVSGVPDYYPFIDGLNFVFQAARYSGDSGSSTGPDYRNSYQGMVRESSNTFDRVEYSDDTFTSYNNWDILGRTGSEIQLQAFVEDNDGTQVTTTLDPAVPWLKLPPSVQSWSGSTFATNSSDSITIQYQAAFVRQEDLPLTPPGFAVPTLRGWPHISKRADEPEVRWNNCWMWTLDYSMLAGETTVSSGNDTLWYAPSVGLVWDRSREENVEGNWSWTESYLTDVFFPQGSGSQ
jgi:methionine-rich copper-binding protein CopC